MSAWPIPVCVLLLIVFLFLRRPLVSLLDRVKSVKIAGQEITTTSVSAVVKQDEAIASATQPKKLAEIPIPQTWPIRPVLGFDSSIVKSVLSEWQVALPKAIPDASEREAKLMRLAAESLVSLLYEFIYSIAFGSQLVALRDLNSAGRIQVSALRPYFDAAKAQYPEVYKDDSFERWLGFLVNVAQAVKLEGDTVEITTEGRDFIHFIVSRSYVFVKSF